MAVCREEVRPSVEVVIEEEQTEGELQQRAPADRGRRRPVDEQPVRLARVERHHLVREVSDRDAVAPRAVVVGGIDAHAGARRAGLVERDTGRQADVPERAVARVAIEAVRLPVVGDEQIDPPVIVVVEQRHAERLGVRVVDARRAGHVVERAVPRVVEQRRALAVVRLGRAVRLPRPVQRAEQVLVDRPLDVVRDEQIEEAVAVVVEPGGARREAGIGDARPIGDIHEPPAARVAKQVVASERRDVEVGAAVVVEVGARHAHPVHLDLKAGGARLVHERAVSPIAIERGVGCGTRTPWPLHRVDEKEVLPSVAVGVEKRHPGSHRLGQVLLSERAAGVLEMDPRGRGDVGERHARKRHRLLGDGCRHGRDAQSQRRHCPCSWICWRSLLSFGFSSRYSPVIACEASSALSRSYNRCSRVRAASSPRPW